MLPLDGRKPRLFSVLTHLLSVDKKSLVRDMVMEERIKEENDLSDQTLLIVLLGLDLALKLSIVLKRVTQFANAKFQLEVTYISVRVCRDQQ